MHVPDNLKNLPKVKPFRAAMRGAAIGFAPVGAAAHLAGTASRFMTGMMNGIFPNTIYPQASGRFGLRTSTQAGPAGIEGLRFNFRRK